MWSPSADKSSAKPFLQTFDPKTLIKKSARGQRVMWAEVFVVDHGGLGGFAPKGYNLRFPTPDPNKELGPTSWSYYVYFSSFPGGQERIPRHCFWSMSGRLLFQTRLRPWGRTQRAIRVHKPVTFWFPFWTSVAETTMLSDIPPHTHIWRPQYIWIYAFSRYN